MTVGAKIDEARLKCRYRVLLIFFAFSFLVLSVRLGVLQVLEYQNYLEKARENIEAKTALKAERGIIYDRNMVPLAVNKTTWRVYVTPRDVKNTDEASLIAKGMSLILGVNEETVYKGITNKSTRDRTVKKNVSESEKEAILDFIISNSLYHCLHIEATTSRYYPFGQLCAHVIGFVGTDGGLNGVEAYYDAYLKGVDGAYVTHKNAQGQELPNNGATYIEAVNGSDVILTIDITVQSMLEAQLKEAYNDASARQRVTGVALDPSSGAVLAMATYPAFDLNDPYTLSSYYVDKLSLCEYDEGSEEYKKLKNNYLYEMWNNKAVSVLYEPGSTFKIITTSVALEEKVTTVNECFHCSGALKVDGYGTPIRCHKRVGHGSINFAEALQKSCNPTMIRLAQRIGNTRFMDYFKAFGYTGKTGIDLQGEAIGIYHSDKDFNGVELAVYSFGQTFKTTPLQQITAVSCVANGGVGITPFVVSKISNNGDIIYYKENNSNKRVISETTAQTITRILVDGVDGDGGAKNAGVSGYDVAAKTGTSQKRDIKNENLYVGSCVAYSVNSSADVAVIIAVDEPMCQNYYGSTVAAPYVSAFLSGALPYLGAEPSYTSEEEAKLNVTVDSYVGLKVVEAKKLVSALGLDVEIIGNGDTVEQQSPTSATKICKENGKVTLYTSGEEKNTVNVPKLEGLTATEAIKALVDASLNVQLSGVTTVGGDISAVVVKQSVPAGTEIIRGSAVAITLRYITQNE